jgi:primosomal protein N' (replication factor Y)
LIRDRDDAAAERHAAALAAEIERYLIANPQIEGVDVLGPAPAFAVRVRGQYGWQILLRGDAAPRALGELRIPPGWTVDVDPVSLL